MENPFIFLEANNLDGIRRVFSSVNINQKNKDGYTPLYFCCMKKSIKLPTIGEVIKMGAGIDAKGDDDETPLFIATFHNREDVVKLLLSSGADINGVNNTRKETALHAAARLGYENLLVFLIKSGANLNARNSLLETPAYCAAKCGKHETLYYLISAGANLKVTNEDGKDPLFIASERNHRNVVILLKASKDELKHAKAAADAELFSTQKAVLSTEEIATRMINDESFQERVKAQKLEAEVNAHLAEDRRPEIIDIRIPKPKVRSSDPFSGNRNGPCKSLEEVGYDEPPEIPESLRNLPPSRPRRIGSTTMVVETENGPVAPIRIDGIMEESDVSYYIPSSFIY